ncbi:unnamed protein product [Schistosoma turkestanicum]|nr:unnamed protein product [Schistosoma turkestanicum]
MVWGTPTGKTTRPNTQSVSAWSSYFNTLGKITDFLGPGARYSIPNQCKWNERMISNLIYYQSNYFLLSFVIIILLSALNPVPVLIGLLVTCLPLVILLFLDTKTLHNINQPKILIPVCVVIAMLLIHFISGIVLFFCVLLVPVLNNVI